MTTWVALGIAAVDLALWGAFVVVIMRRRDLGL
jgi:hypothetical protein